MMNIILLHLSVEIILLFQFSVAVYVRSYLLYFIDKKQDTRSLILISFHFEINKKNHALN